MNGVEKESSSPKVLLIPWDPESPEHIKRMTDQRIACGWKYDEIETWRPLQRSGQMTLQWVVLPPTTHSTPSLLHKHTTTYPDESSPIHDTATTFSAQPRSPTSQPFIPVGHISLDTTNSQSPALANPDLGIYCISTLYISRALHSSGLGRATMDRIEHTAASPPIHAKVLALNTLASDQLERTDMWDALGSQGWLERPALDSQRWYERRGYVVFGGRERAFSRADESGKEWWMKDVWMRKEISHQSQKSDGAA